MVAMQVVIILTPLPTMKDYNNANRGRFVDKISKEPNLFFCFMSDRKITITLQQQKKYFAGGIDKIEMIKKQAFYRGTFDFSSINGSIKLKIIKK